jgi:heme-degrading monooxygenase HmoA
MYARTTLVEIDTVRVSMQETLQLFQKQVLPGLEAQEGYLGVFVLTTPEGRGLIMSLWDSEEASARAGAFAAGVLERFMTLFRAPPGRETYEVVIADVPTTAAARGREP